ncbi:MAG: macrocin O-methyltransferase [Gallionella sp.]|nr:macrocin O-methyltransferase [Gallionella sp.]
MIFEESSCAVDKKLANFSKYVRRQNIARFLAQTEIFKLQLPVKGSIVECGVHHGGGVMAWAKLSTTLEPYNYHRKIIGFDTFAGFPHVAPIDVLNRSDVKAGMFSEAYNIYDELNLCVKEYDENRFLNHIPKIDLVQGDANLKIPEYLEKNPHLLVSLLYLDFDVYEPTVTALKTLLPRMPKGAVLAFDEVNNADWPGETKAMLEQLNIRDCELRCFEYEPNISYMVL